FITNNVEKARITAAGNFGLGTTTPYSTFALQANASSTNTTLFASGSTTNTAGTYSTTTLFSIDNQGEVGIGQAAAAGSALSVNGTAGGKTSFNASSGETRILVDPNGNKVALGSAVALQFTN